MTPSSSVFEPDYAAAAQLLANADALLIGAGAGMGVDSGLPAFRGNHGFWTAYPAYQGQSFADLACPQTFTADPELAWGFYGHRLNLYRQRPSHAGFAILRRWAEAMPHGYFVMTSNVDGHFHRAGFAPERVYECHGSIHYLQCHADCMATWPADAVQLDIDPQTCRTRSALPRCPHCGALARPNLLMFYDGDWLGARYEAQRRRYQTWLRSVQNRRLVALELGAGTTIATVRRSCESSAWPLIRINPQDTEPAHQGVLLPVGALAGLTPVSQHDRDDRRPLMTPKQRDVMTSLKRQIRLLENHYRHMKRQIRVLSEQFEESPIIEAGDFTPAEVDGLVRLNQRLSSLEHYLCEVGQQESARLDVRVADPNDPLDDYEIDATLYFAMRENDPDFDDRDDNFMTQRDLSLKCADNLADDIDHHETYMEFPGRLNDIPHCWLFHDLYDHCYGLEQPALSLQDCLRVGWIWVDIAIRHQSSLDIDTGEWLQPKAQT